MSNLHQVEEEDKKTPLLCIYGDEPNLQEQLISENLKKFRIILVSEKKPNYLEAFPEIYFLTYKDASLMPRLEEVIDYAIVFATEEKNTEALSSLMVKLSVDKSHVLFVLKVFGFIQNLETIHQYKQMSNIRFALLGEFLTRKKIDQKGELSKIIGNVIENQEINLKSDHLSSIYPISIHDSLTGISRLLFGNFKANTIHFLFYKKPETVLSATHLIARLEPDIKIKFSDEKGSSLTISREEINSIIASRLQMAHSYLDSSFDGFDKTFIKMREEIILPEEEKEVEATIKSRRRKKRGRKITGIIKFTFLSLFFGGFLFIFLNLLFFGLGLLYLRSAVEDIKNENFQNVVPDAKTSNYFLSIIKPTTDFSFEVISSIDSLQKIEGTYALLQRGAELSELTGNTFTLLFKTNPLSEKTLATITSSLTFLYQEGQRIQIETGNKTLAQRLKQTYSKLLSTSEVLPIVLGFHGEKDYLLLFQNDEELRPTGGFIGSIGNLSLKDGRVDHLSIQDVYELDGQLRNHIEPPFIVRRYLQPHLYLRDSNFSLNFQEAASTSALLYNLESGKKPDAVIAIDLEVLRQILKISGPIQLPAYNITVTSDSVSNFLQSTIKNSFFPGSTEKRDVLNSVFTQLLLKTSKDPKFYTQLAQLLPDLLEQKDILISFSDNSIQKIFSANSYAGEFNDTRVDGPRSINDFLYINEANIGENKVNASVSRKVTYEAMVEQGKLESKATLTLTNTSSIDGYKVYVKFVVPRGSVLKQILIDNIKKSVIPAVTDFKIYESKTFKLPSGLETEQYTKDNFTYFAFVVTVNKDSKADVEVDYDNGAVKPLSTIADYSLLYIKQPGVRPYSLTTTVDYPEGYLPVNSSADSFGKNFLEQSFTVTKDVRTNIEIQKASVQK